MYRSPWVPPALTSFLNTAAPVDTAALFAPTGATGCRHGWSDAALSVAQPVEDLRESQPAPAGAEARPAG
ncbi:MAG: hypothetical protein JSR77_01545 [Planctomycetes bacterium]|nr:hypothetical protein [Planctomycetota bacterium]